MVLLIGTTVTWLKTMKMENLKLLVLLRDLQTTFTPKLALTTTTLSLPASNSPPPQLNHKTKPKYLLPGPSYLKATQFLLAQDHNLNVTASNQLEVGLFNMEEN